MITLAIDAQGGYFPHELVAAVAAASKTRGVKPVYFTLVGDERELTRHLGTLSHNPERISVIHAPHQAAMSEAPHLVMQERPEHPVAIASQLVKEGLAQAVISAGNPGLAVLSARAHLSLLPGVSRAALCSVYPTQRTPGELRPDALSLLLDVGASLSASAADLVDFAQMGAAYARVISDMPRPRVALLSSSREPQIGPRHIVEAYELLQAQVNAPFDFIGCVEGHDIPSGAADVIVCEGFVGDVVIKLLEGVGETAVALARSAYERKFVYRQGLRLLSGGLEKIQRLLDYEEYGGAPLLGFEQLVILAHPRSRQRAFDNAIKLAIRNVQRDLTLTLASAVNPTP